MHLGFFLASNYSEATGTAAQSVLSVNILFYRSFVKKKVLLNRDVGMRFGQ